jgi:hypothetical protein
MSGVRTSFCSNQSCLVYRENDVFLKLKVIPISFSFKVLVTEKTITTSLIALHSILDSKKAILNTNFLK